MKSEPSYCRICSACCGVLVDVERDRVTKVVGDRDHPTTRGFTCTKGRHLGDLHHHANRLLMSQRRGHTGFEPIDAGTATAEIGSRLNGIMAEHGPDAVGLYLGTQSYGATLTHPFATAWFRSLGSRKLFTTMTIDQSAKYIAGFRLGVWEGGDQRFADADVWLLVGGNPMVSSSGLSGIPNQDGRRRVIRAQARGLRLIVVDPRRTETARLADIHVQLRPGTDAVLLAAMLHVLFAEELTDAAFCATYVDGLDRLRRAVSTASPEATSEMTGVPPDVVRAAARTFGRGPRGMARSGTGPDMGPWSNLNEHLVQALNVVCGRFPRSGERPAGQAILRPTNLPRAEVRPPTRTWESGYKSRSGYGLLGTELPTATLPDEILLPGDGRLRALVVSGGNPAAAIPDGRRAVDALKALDLLIVIDPFLTDTSRLAHYVIAPTMQLERPDCTHFFEGFWPEPYAQYARPLLPRPAGVIEDWEFFFDLASSMDRTLQVGPVVVAPGDPRPTSEEMLTAFVAGGRVALDEVRAHRHGHVFDDLPTIRVEEARPGVATRFDLFPDDVAADLSRALGGERIVVRPDRPFSLTVRRSKETMNSLGHRVPGLARPYNVCFMHPTDLVAIGAADGSVVELVSDHGAIKAIAGPDPTLSMGMVTLAHCAGDLLEDPDPLRGANPSQLLSLEQDIETINAMPRMTAVPVAIAAVEAAGATDSSIVGCR